jgi:hypothetical protein
MQITLMKGTIHRAQVTQADLHYEGSISIDRALIDAAGFIVNERVDIYNIDTGARLDLRYRSFAQLRYDRLERSGCSPCDDWRQTHHRFLCEFRTHRGAKLQPERSSC